MPEQPPKPPQPTPYNLAPEDKDLMGKFDFMFRNVLGGIQASIELWVEGIELGSERMLTAALKPFTSDTARVTRRIQIMEAALPELEHHSKRELAELHALFTHSIEILRHIDKLNEQIKGMFSADPEIRLAAALPYIPRLTEFQATLQVPVDMLKKIQADPQLSQRILDILIKKRPFRPKNSPLAVTVEAMTSQDPEMAFQATMAFIEYTTYTRGLKHHDPQILSVIQKILEDELNELRNVIISLSKPTPSMSLEQTKPILRTLNEDLLLQTLAMHPVSEALRRNPVYLAYRAQTNELERKEKIEADKPTS